MAGPGSRVGIAAPAAIGPAPGIAVGPSVSTPGGALGLPGALSCPVCGGENHPGMNFCRLCGGALAAPRPPPSSVRMPTPVPGSRAAGPPVELFTCRRCGGQTAAGFAFCQHCGAMLPTPPGMRGRTPPIEPIHEAVAPTLAASTPGVDDLHARPAPIPVPMPTPPPVAARAPAGPREHRPALGSGERPWGSLYTVRRDGTDGDRYPLAGDWVEIGGPGATAADLVFDDRYLAGRHARLEQQPGGGCRVVPIDLLNGVYRRLRAPHVLVSGAQILIGRELLRFELVEEAERGDVPPLSRFGVTMFGSPPRAPWGRLMQVIASGGLRDVRHLHGAEVVLGREEGDIVFRDDEFLSRRHAALRWQGGQCVLEDLKSSNGTFIRLRGPQPLDTGDTLRMGDQMFRIELGAA
jgi:hypothetical protein